MRRVVVAAAGIALAVTPVVAGATGAGATEEGTAQESGGEQELVVAFDEAGATAALDAIAAAGGTVVSVNDAVNIALVAADSGAIAQISDVAGVVAVARNHSIGTTRPGMPHRFAEERPSAADRAAAARTDAGAGRSNARNGRTEPLSDLQWDMAMIGATPDKAHRRATGRGVTVGVIDTGVDASHPDIAPNFSASLSRNFTMDIPAIDDECEVPTCIDPANVDDGGHGTHVAGTIAAARNGLGIAGVAPDATIVNVRAGQDSGFFFVYETVAALTYAGDAGLDVVNMSFYTDPWLYNCASADDYLSEAPPTADEIADQAFVRQVVLAALDYAHARGVTLVGSAGNSHFNLALPQRFDNTSPDYPPGSEVDRLVTDNCLDLPAEGPDVIGVSAVGPSTTKADYSNYGLGDVEVSAPGGWFRDGFGTPTFQTPGNLILSSYPRHVAEEEGLIENGVPTDAFSIVDCKGDDCGVYTYLQGTSMASPHVAGVAALVIEEHGQGSARRGYSLDPDTVRSIIEDTATDHACPAGGEEDYTDEGRGDEFNAVCEGTTADNGLYGEGIVDAAKAVARGR